MSSPCIWITSKRLSVLELDFVRESADGDARQQASISLSGVIRRGSRTLLKCLAMAVSGPTIANQQLVSTAGWIRHNAAKDRRVECNSIGTPSTISFEGRVVLLPRQSRSGLVFEAEKNGLTPVLKGEGATGNPTNPCSYRRTRSVERGCERLVPGRLRPVAASHRATPRTPCDMPWPAAISPVV